MIYDVSTKQIKLRPVNLGFGLLPIGNFDKNDLTINFKKFGLKALLFGILVLHFCMFCAVIFGNN